MSGGEELVEKLLGMTNTFGNWDKYSWQLGQIHLVIGQIPFAIGTNTFCNCDPHREARRFKNG